MKGSTRSSILLNVRFCAIFLCGVIFGFGLCYVFFVAKAFRELEAEKTTLQIELLCKTDPQVLLEACRELSKRVKAGDLKSGRYNIRNHPQGQALRFPKVILDLRPRYVYIDENDIRRVMIPIFGGLFGHFGVTAYTEDYIESRPKQKYGDRELIPGLWYYDDKYLEDPAYDKRIDELIKEYKK